MKYSLAMLPLFLVQVCCAQFFTVKEVKDSTHMFIEIHSSQRPEVAEKINQVLQKDWGYNPAAKDPFENISVVEEASFNYDISANNERVLSFSIESSYAAAGLHITRELYVFDSRTGASVDQSRLFSADGSLKKALYKSFKAALKTASSDTADFRADEYKACLAEAEKISEIDYNSLLIMDGGIRFWAGSCLEGTAYDFEADRSHGPYDYSLGKMLPMLTPYGYSLFVDKQSAPVQTLMRGMIDEKYPISLTLFPGKDHAITGMIVYNRIGEPINLRGTMNGNNLILHELDPSNAAVSNIEVSWDGGKLTGSFINLKAKKQMSFVVMEVR